jgi:hypothetical protein
LRLSNLFKIKITPTYRLVVTRQSQLLLNFFNVRVVVNGNQIYQLDKEQSVVIPLENNRPQLVVTDGFHYTQSLEVACQRITTYYLKIVCAIDDNLIAVGLVLWGLFYIVGLVSGILLLQALSFLPILYFLYYYYINREEFIKVKLVRYI